MAMSASSMTTVKLMLPVPKVIISALTSASAMQCGMRPPMPRVCGSC
ncbi:MAG: hypothetical protein IPK74_25620 [Deltaproteobacteria bacterium]|nr:hypothetical protein [Deltaproteobacteria bacterium]